VRSNYLLKIFTFIFQKFFSFCSVGFYSRQNFIFIFIFFLSLSLALFIIDSLILIHAPSPPHVFPILTYPAHRSSSPSLKFVLSFSPIQLFLSFSNSSTRSPTKTLPSYLSYLPHRPSSLLQYLGNTFSPSSHYPFIFVQIKTILTSLFCSRADILRNDNKLNNIYFFPFTFFIFRLQ
jgi:hypothetical protein